MGRFLKKLAWLVTGGIPRLMLSRKENAFTLGAFRGKTPANIIKLLEKWPQISSLASLPPQNLNVLHVPVAQLCNTRLILQQAADLPITIEIAPEVLSLQPVACPFNFAIAYAWTTEGLARQFSVPADYFEDGWLVSGEKFWQIEITPKDDEWLRLKKITGDKAIEFLSSMVPDWRARNLPVQCDISYTEEPALAISIFTVSKEAVQINVRWCDDPKNIHPAPTVDNHVTCGTNVRPGIAPQVLDVLGKNREANLTLKSETIPQFICEFLPRIQRWTTGPLQELGQQHPIVDAVGTLILTIKREETEGIGSVAAIPEFVCGEIRGNAEQISYNLGEARKFLRIRDSWIPIAAVKAAGIGQFGRATDGTLLGRISLGPAEVLTRSSHQLNGPWRQELFPEIRYPSTSADRGAHVEFLLHWGVPGGIAGNVEEAHHALRESIIKLKTAHPGVQVLVIAGRKTLDQIRIEWEPLGLTCLYGLKNDPQFKDNMPGVIFATPKALEEIPKLQKSQWNLLALLEADTLIKTANSKLFQQICECNGALTIGSFTSTAFLARNSHRAALTQAFKIPAGRGSEVVWKYGLADSQQRPPQHLPELPATPDQMRTSRAAEYVVGAAAQRGSPVPSRPAYSAPSNTNELMRVHVTFSTGEDVFVGAARKLVNHEAATAQFVPFECYRPGYTDMSEQQSQWYFYWRSRVRANQYPETSLSYIFVHIYELINGVGSLDTEDGYRQLRNLWLNYREKHSKLDYYLPDWICDYILVNGCSIDPIQPYQDLLEAGAVLSKPDLVFVRHLENRAAPPPLQLLSYYSNYSVRHSKFYNGKTAPILEEKLPHAFSYMNRAGLGPDKKPLVEAFRPHKTETISRSVFQGAVYAGARQQVTVGTVYPYIYHEPFRVLITSFFKYSENKLRQALQHKFLLRGMELPPEAQAALDRYFAQHPVTSSQPRRIEIDITRVQQLKMESDQVRKMLLENASQDQEEPVHLNDSNSARNGRRFPRPPGTPDHLLTDLDEVFRVLSRLDERELGFIKTMMQAGWEADDARIGSASGDLLLENAIEHINQFSLQHLGDLLIATEAGQRVIAEDFRDELEHLLIYHEKDLHPSAGPENGLPPEWTELRSRLADAQRRALAAISACANTRHELDQIAKECGSMPEVLVEGINELAMETIGDIIIDSGSSPPTVEEEDREFVEKILALG